MNSTTVTSEQRRNRRLFVEKPVGVAVLAGAFSYLIRRPQFQARTRNVSTQGLELLATQPLAVGAALKLWMPVQIGGLTPTIELRGTVVWAGVDAATGLKISRIQLDNRPHEAMELWSQSIVEKLRLSEA